MKMTIALASLLAASTVFAADVAPVNELRTQTLSVERVQYGSGTPTNSALPGFDSAVPVTNDLYHVPGFLPGYPTAATLWAKVITVDCTRKDGGVVCGGYNVNQAQLGRGEYVYVRPVIHEDPPPVPQITVPPITPIEPVIPEIIKKKIVKPKPRFICKPA